MTDKNEDRVDEELDEKLEKIIGEKVEERLAEGKKEEQKHGNPAESLKKRSKEMSRRKFLKVAGLGAGALGLSSMSAGLDIRDSGLECYGGQGSTKDFGVDNDGIVSLQNDIVDGSYTVYDQSTTTLGDGNVSGDLNDLNNVKIASTASEIKTKIENGGTIMIDPGNGPYSVSEISVSNSSTMIIGNGAELQPDGDHPVFRVTAGGNSNRGNEVRVRDLFLNDTNTNTVVSNKTPAIALDSSNNAVEGSVLDNIRFQNFAVDVQTQGSTSNSNAFHKLNRLVGSEFRRHHVHIKDDAEDCTVFQNSVFSSSCEGHAAILFNWPNGSSGTSHRVIDTVIQNYGSTAGNHGISIDQVQGCVMINVEADFCYGRGLEVKNAADGSSRGRAIYSHGSKWMDSQNNDGVVLNNSEDGIFVGDHFAGNNNKGLHIQSDCEGIHVLNPSVEDNSGDSIHVDGDNCKIEHPVGDGYNVVIDGKSYLNGVGQVAAGGTPTESNWKTGDLVEDTSNDNLYWLGTDGTFTQI